MKEKTAQAIVDAAIAFYPLIARLYAAVENVEDIPLRDQLTNTVGDIMGELHFVMHPCQQEYPHLIPQEERRPLDRRCKSVG